MDRVVDCRKCLGNRSARVGVEMWVRGVGKVK
jgi:hypothetical protein